MCILIVSYDRIMRDTLKGFLFDQGRQTVTYDALDKIIHKNGGHPGNIELLIVDFERCMDKFPDEISIFHDQHPFTPIIIALDQLDFLSVYNSMPFEIYWYLRKPILLVELELLISRLNQYHKFHSILQ